MHHCICPFHGLGIYFLSRYIPEKMGSLLWFSAKPSYFIPFLLEQGSKLLPD
jgi:hypothetical protein